MANKNTPKKNIAQVDTPLQLESVVIAHEQEIQKLAEGNVSLLAKNSKLQDKIDNLETRNKLLTDERIKLRASFYTITMAMQDFQWCVPQLKKRIKNIVKIAIN